MSNATLNLIAKEQSKLQRQLDNLESTKLDIEVLGETPRKLNNLARQEAAVAETRANIEKLNKHAGTLKAAKK